MAKNQNLGKNKQEIEERKISKKFHKKCKKKIGQKNFKEKKFLS